ncbi:MAG: hypothetical protein K6F34_01470, partial [Lachnospiraceae bacterium]|nr:hypothetical protein [Lachnospiraceae bacterium]
FEGGANELSLIQCRKNYEMFGACEERFASRVRKPTEEEKSAPGNYKPDSEEKV